MSETSAPHVYCFDENGEAVPVPRADLTLAPAVYGVLVEEARALLLSIASPSYGFDEPPLETPLWCLIGGRIAAGDTPSAALARFFRRSTGFAPRIDRLIRTETRHIIEQGRPWALSELFYAVSRPSGATIVPRQGEYRPVWVPLEDLTYAAIPFGYHAIANHHEREEEP